MAFFDKIKGKKNTDVVTEDVDIVVMSKDEFNNIIDENRYTDGDNTDVIVNKYENIIGMDEKSMNNDMKSKRHDAMLVFVNSITLFTQKDDILEFLVRTMQYTRSNTFNDALHVVANIGFKAVKTAHVLTNIASFGLTSSMMNQAEKITKKVLTTNDGELASAWEMKIKAQIQLAKKTYGGLLRKDKDFLNQLKSIENQLAHK